MSSLRLVGFSGSTRRPSRTRALIETVAGEIALRRAVDFDVFDLIDAGIGLAAFSRDSLSPRALAIVEAIENADALIVGSPVYKGSYAGLFKHLLDFIDPLALAGKPVILTATGGGYRHALVVEHQLRPLFGFFGSQSVPTSIYASDADFRDGGIVDGGVLQRVAQAASELDFLAPRIGTGRPIANVA